MLDALRRWLDDDWPIGRHVFVTNEQFARQFTPLDETDLILRFEIAEPEKPGRYLAYG